MPRRSSYLRVMDEYLRDVRMRGLSDSSDRNYKYTILRAYRSLKENNLLKHPKKLGLEELNVILRDFKNSKNYILQYKIFLNWVGNPIMKRMRFRFPERMNVDWLTIPQMEIVKVNLQTPLEKILYCLEGEMGLRRIETKRLRLQDIKNDYLMVHGKGHKWRAVTQHPYFPETLQIWMDERDLMIARAKEYNPSVQNPPELLIWQRFGTLNGYLSRNGLANAWESVSARVGFHISHHTMRRSFGRSMWELLGDDCLLSLSEIYGHSNRAQTEKYIQVELKHMKTTMDEYAKRMFQRVTIQIQNPI